VDSGAKAVGELQIDSALLQTILTKNGSVHDDDSYPISDLESLSITVTGASEGNGTFTAADFNSFNWWTAGATFDVTKNMVGQSLTNEFGHSVLWGTGGAGDLNGGDFNFFAKSFPAPSYDGNFEIGAFFGQVSLMNLTSLEEVVPEPSSVGLLALGGAALVLISRRRVRS
jgi:PEP-CTERM motif-containing protein